MNNQIPVSQFDPVSVKVLALVPKPIGPNFVNGQIGNNYQNPWLGQTRSFIPSLKLDHNVGTKLQPVRLLQRDFAGSAVFEPERQYGRLPDPDHGGARQLYL